MKAKYEEKSEEEDGDESVSPAEESLGVGAGVHALDENFASRSFVLGIIVGGGGIFIGSLRVVIVVVVVVVVVVCNVQFLKDDLILVCIDDTKEGASKVNGGCWDAEAKV